MFLVLSLLFSASCWFIMSFSVGAVRRYLTLVAPLLEKMTTTDLASILVFHERVLQPSSLSSCVT